MNSIPVEWYLRKVISTCLPLKFANTSISRGVIRVSNLALVVLYSYRKRVSLPALCDWCSVWLVLFRDLCSANAKRNACAIPQPQGIFSPPKKVKWKSSGNFSDILNRQDWKKSSSEEKGKKKKAEETWQKYEKNSEGKKPEDQRRSAKWKHATRRSNGKGMIGNKAGYIRCVLARTASDSSSGQKRHFCMVSTRVWPTDQRTDGHTLL